MVYGHTQRYQCVVGHALYEYDLCRTSTFVSLSGGSAKRAPLLSMLFKGQTLLLWDMPAYTSFVHPPIVTHCLCIPRAFAATKRTGSFTRVVAADEISRFLCIPFVYYFVFTYVQTLTEICLWEKQKYCHTLASVVFCTKYVAHLVELVV